MSMTTHPSAGRSRRGRRPAAALLLPAVLLLGQACGGGGGGGGASQLCIDFTPARAAESGTVSSQLSEDSSCQLAEIEIVATDIDDVFAFKSVVDYDPDVAVFLGFSLVGSALESDGGDVTVVVEEETFGELTIGATRIASTDGVNISGTQVLIKLAFARFAVAGSSGAFELDSQCLLSGGTPPTVLSNTCTGGTLVAR